MRRSGSALFRWRNSRAFTLLELLIVLLIIGLIIALGLARFGEAIFAAESMKPRVAVRNALNDAAPYYVVNDAHVYDGILAGDIPSTGMNPVKADGFDCSREVALERASTRDVGFCGVSEDFHAAACDKRANAYVSALHDSSVEPPTRIKKGCIRPIYCGGPIDSTGDSAIDLGCILYGIDDPECKLDGGDWASCLDTDDPCTCKAKVHVVDLAPGPHTARVRGVDSEGNTRTGSYSWRVVSDAPYPQTEPTVNFPANPAVGDTIEVPDLGDWANCGAGCSYEVDWESCDATIRTDCTTRTGSFSGGVYRYVIQPGDAGRRIRPVISATNPAGKKTKHRCVDSEIVVGGGGGSSDIAPQVTITTGANTVSFSITLAAGRTVSTYHCSIDGSERTPCSNAFNASGTTSVDLSGISQGTHSFTVEVTDSASQTGSASKSFLYDTVAPTLTITSQPPATTTESTASVSFTSGDANPVTVSCKLDTGSFTACSSPFTLTGIGIGDHTISVRAADSSGNATSRSVSWTRTSVCSGENYGVYGALNPDEAYATRVQSFNPWAYWRLNQASGTSVVDSSGNSRTGSYSGCCNLNGDSVSFLGNGNASMAALRTTSPNAGWPLPGWTANGNLTLTMRVKPNVAIANFPYAESNGMTSYDNAINSSNAALWSNNWTLDTGKCGVGVHVGTNGIIVTEHRSSFLFASARYAQTIPSGSFTDVTVVFASMQPKIYVNGTLVRTGLVADSRVCKSIMPTIDIGGGAYGPVYLGRNNKWFNGTIRDVSVIAGSLSASDVNYLANG